MLLVLGGALLGVAALAFTVISWGSLGMGARALVLLSFTALALGAVWPLARRGLAATAETLAMLGLVLVVLEGYAAYAGDLFGLGSLDGRWYAVIAASVLTVGWGLYGRVAPLRLTGPQTVVLGQSPLPLAAFAVDVSASWMGMALVLLSAADLGVRRLAAGREGAVSVRAVAGLCGVSSGAAGIFLALAVSYRPDHGDSEASVAAVLLVAAAVAMGWAVLAERLVAAAAGLTFTAAVTVLLPYTWTAATGAAVAVTVMASALLLLPVPLRRPAAGGAATVLGVAVLWIAPDVVVAAFSPLQFVVDRWTAESERLFLTLPRWTDPSAPFVLGILAAALLLVRRRAAVPPVAASAVLSAIVVAQPPYAVTLALAVGLVAALAALTVWTVLDERVRAIAGGTAVAAGLWAAAASLLTRPATISVLAALTLIGVACVAATHAEARAGAGGGRRTAFGVLDGAVAATVVAFGGLVAASGLASGIGREWAAFGVLAAAGVGLLAAAWARSVAAETAAWAVAVAGVAMAAGNAAFLSVALAVAGVLAFADALRDGRRHAGLAGSALLLAAWWVRLGSADITVPEAYTAPITLALLAIGLARRSRRPELSSWAAYGPALASTLLPSVLAAWADPAGPRPVLLAVAALAVTLAGARARLQAPLLLGGATLLLVAVRALGPYAARVVLDLPGWFPIAFAGLVVLVVGATYERRLRDLRRLHAAVSRLG
ncbi:MULTISPECIES: SCO7613 C-terminal domain-containing membrane protein [Actinomadura]|uniref:SCO7613 C-terminal domain-containing membrane protein n=1 Tax=Actinomadura yumaensis TaxID=111807 RepID=A0ABW2CRD9_9ACTN|nr:hypothetical protein [Actinomadura sp. J1-007]MWK35240.1 hypothetical protein [Actinomadura sp. J1-007]